MTNKTLFWSFFANFCTSCASLWPIKHIFSQLLNKAISMALWTKSITCDKAGFKSRFCQVHQVGKNIISVNPVILSNFSSCFCAFLWLKNQFNQRNLRLINDLRSTKDYVRKNKLFMQNKANFRKVKLYVTPVNTKDYDQLDTWSIRKTKPIQSQLKPIKANSKPIQSQLKPIQSQLKPILCQNKANSNPISEAKKDIAAFADLRFYLKL